jgi:hypothetical protein
MNMVGLSEYKNDRGGSYFAKVDDGILQTRAKKIGDEAV